MPAAAVPRVRLPRVKVLSMSSDWKAPLAGAAGCGLISALFAWSAASSRLEAAQLSALRVADIDALQRAAAQAPGGDLGTVAIQGRVVALPPQRTGGSVVAPLAPELLHGVAAEVVERSATSHALYAVSVNNDLREEKLYLGTSVERVPWGLASLAPPQPAAVVPLQGEGGGSAPVSVPAGPAIVAIHPSLGEPPRTALPPVVVRTSSTLAGVVEMAAALGPVVVDALQQAFFTAPPPPPPATGGRRGHAATAPPALDEDPCADPNGGNSSARGSTVSRRRSPRATSSSQQSQPAVSRRLLLGVETAARVLTAGTVLTAVGHASLDASGGLVLSAGAGPTVLSLDPLPVVVAAVQAASATKRGAAWVVGALAAGLAVWAAVRAARARKGGGGCGDEDVQPSAG